MSHCVKRIALSSLSQQPAPVLIDGGMVVAHLVGQAVLFVFSLPTCKSRVSIVPL